MKWEYLHYIKYKKRKAYYRFNATFPNKFVFTFYLNREMQEADRNLSSPESDKSVPGSQEHFSDISRAPCTKIYIQ